MRPHSLNLLRPTSRCIAFKLAGVLAALAFVIGPVQAHTPQPIDSAKARATETPELRQAAQDLTLELIASNARLSAADSGERGQRLAELLATARSRRDAMSALLDLDPAEALRVAIPGDLRNRFPREAGPFLEQKIQLEGVLKVLHVDHVDAALDRYLYVLETEQHGELSLYFAGKAPEQTTGNSVRVTGLKIDDALLVTSSDTAKSLKAARTTTSNVQSTLGPQKTLTILVNFVDDTSQPFTVASAQATMFTTVSNYWYEASYQQTTLVGDVAGWFTIPVSTTTCDYMSIASYAKQAASKAGFNLSEYTRFLYAFPGSTCTWWGLSYVGGNPSESWIAAKQGFTLTAIGHELGHALGLFHSHAFDCGSVPLAPSGCTEAEYGDVFDIMGGPGSGTPHYNAFQKEQLGWLNGGVSPPVTTVPSNSGSSTFTIAPLELARDSAPRALKIARPAACGATADYLYIESRQALGFDTYLSANTSAVTGVLVHNATPGKPNSSYLLDMTPATDMWRDGALAAGMTFTDPTSAFAITPLSIGSSGTLINVNVPPVTCIHATPTIALAPSATQFATSGGIANYSVTITNNDSCDCAASPFDVNVIAPTGWSATSAQTPLIAPGTSGSASLVIKAASDAAAAFYTIPTSATNPTAASFTASTNATVAVITTLDVNVATGASTYARPTKRNQTTYVSIGTVVTSDGTPVPGAAVSVQVIKPTGSVTALTGTTSSNGRVDLWYPIKSTDPVGTYAVTSTATLGAMSNSATVSFAVN